MCNRAITTAPVTTALPPATATPTTIRTSESCLTGHIGLGRCTILTGVKATARTITATPTARPTTVLPVARPPTPLLRASKTWRAYLASLQLSRLDHGRTLMVRVIVLEGAWAVVQ